MMPLTVRLHRYVSDDIILKSDEDSFQGSSGQIARYFRGYLTDVSPETFKTSPGRPGLPGFLLPSLCTGVFPE